MEASFKESYLFYHWTLSNATDETSYGITTPFLATKVTCQAIKEKTTKTKLQPSYPKECDHYFSTIWIVGLLIDFDPLDLMLPFDESIMEAMNLTKKPWEINHQRSHFNWNGLAT